MGILCKTNTDGIPFMPIESVIEQKTLRDIGLSNVYNIGNGVGVCYESFNMPQFYMVGAIKPYSGSTSGCSEFFTGATSAHTCDGVYNLSELDDITLTFNFTGDTSYTGYTGHFCYTTYIRTDMLPSINGVYPSLIKGNSKITRCTPYDQITGNTISTTINKSELTTDSEEYIVRPYNIFYNKECAVGNVVDTFTIENQPATFNYDTDWYYVGVTNPPKPILTFDNIGENPFNSVVLRSEIVTITPGLTTTFIVDGRALNGIYLLSVNGITLTEGYDYTVDGKTITLISGTLEPYKDIVQVTYLAIPDGVYDIVNDNELFTKMDAFIVTGTTTGVTEANGTNFVNYNPTRDRYEIFLQNIIDGNSDFFLIINGVRLLMNKETFLSTSDPQKIILDPSITLNNGDAISVFYFTQNIFFRGFLGYLRTETPTITWTLNNTFININNDNGKFLVQVTTKDDPDFNNPVQANHVDYVFNNQTYSLTLDPLGTNIGEYIFRVIFFKRYVATLNNSIMTRNISDTGNFKLNLEYIKNAY